MAFEAVADVSGIGLKQANTIELLKNKHHVAMSLQFLDMFSYVESVAWA